MKHLAVLSLLIFALAVSVARAQYVVTYDSTIVTAFGAQSEYFPVGERVVITYVLDAVPDSNPDPSRGEYYDPVVTMLVSFPGLNLNVECGPGTSLGDASATISNNVVTSTGLVDGAFFSCGQVIESTPIGGSLVSHIDIEFDDVVGPVAEPTMLSSDALPGYPLETEFSYLLIHTSAPGLTQIKFAPPTTPVTLTYDAIVESAIGPHAALFPAGERIQITYALSPNAVDQDTADPLRANYRNAMLGLNVTFPGLGIFGNAGPPRDWADGQIYVTNDGVLPSGALTDQVHLGAFAGSTSTLNGESVSFINVSFEDFPDAPASSPMLTSDALPLEKLSASRQYVSFRTASGNTFVRFVLAPSEQVGMLIGQVDELVAGGTISADVAERLARSLESAGQSIAKGNTGSACSHLRTFVRRVEDEVDAGEIPVAVGEQLIQRAEGIRSQMGC